MIYLRAFVFMLADWMCAWADGDGEPINYRGALSLLRALDAKKAATRCERCGGRGWVAAVINGFNLSEECRLCNAKPAPKPDNTRGIKP